MAVVSLRKIGLPLTVQFAGSGHSVTGIDLNEHTVDQVNRGIEPSLVKHTYKLTKTVTGGHLGATSGYEHAIPDADVVVIALPLLVHDATGDPDLTRSDEATTFVAQHLTSYDQMASGIWEVLKQPRWRNSRRRHLGM